MNARIKAVAVSGLHRGENPQPGAAVIASLRRREPGLRVVGLSYDPMESSLYGHLPDHPDAAYLVPFPGAGEKALYDRLEMIRAKEDLGFIIPCLDSEIENYTAILPKLRKLGIRCILPTGRAFQARDKANLYDFCRRAGVPTPVTKVADNLWAVQQCAEEIGYPVYVKGRLYHATLVKSPADLAPACDEIVQVWGWPLMVQQSVSGEEYDVTGVGDGKGAILTSCAIRKLLRTSHGKGFAGIVVENPEIDRLAQKIIKHLRWDGPFELEFLKGLGQPYSLMEINPRFPAWIDFPSQVGCNMPGLLLDRLLQREAHPLKACTAGQMFVRHSIDLAGDFADFAHMASSGERLLAPAAMPTGEAR